MLQLGDLSRLGEDVTSTLEKVPALIKVIETVRERFSCQNCEAITQPQALFHVSSRGMFCPQMLASILFDKYEMQEPFNRQRAPYAREGVEIALSIIAADQVGAAMVALKPLRMLMESHGAAAGCLHGDDTTIPLQAKSKAANGRICVTNIAAERAIRGIAFGRK